MKCKLIFKALEDPHVLCMLFIIFRLKDVLDDLLEITISDFEEVLKELNLLSGKGSSISYLSLMKIPILFLF